MIMIKIHPKYSYPVDFEAGTRGREEVCCFLLDSIYFSVMLRQEHEIRVRSCCKRLVALELELLIMSYFLSRAWVEKMGMEGVEKKKRNK